MPIAMAAIAARAYFSMCCTRPNTSASAGAAEMQAAAAKVIAALHPKPLPPPPPKAKSAPLPGGGGAEIYDALLEMTPELRAHLKGLVDEIEKNRGRKAQKHA